LIPAIPAIEIMLITTGDGFVKAAWLLISGDPQMIGSILSIGIPPGCGTEKCCVFFPTKNKYLEHLVMVIACNLCPLPIVFLRWNKCHACWRIHTCSLVSSKSP
jgi:hypothetical protein